MNKTLVDYLAVGAAGFIGSILRLAVSSFCGSWFGPVFPIGTLVINLSGSLFLGWFAATIANRQIVSPTTALAIGVGFVGAYTTFSTFMYESQKLIDDGALYKAAANLLGSLVLGLLAVGLGVRLAGK